MMQLCIEDIVAVCWSFTPSTWRAPRQKLDLVKPWGKLFNFLALILFFTSSSSFASLDFGYIRLVWVWMHRPHMSVDQIDDWMLLECELLIWWFGIKIRLNLC